MKYCRFLLFAIIFLPLTIKSESSSLEESMKSQYERRSKKRSFIAAVPSNREWYKVFFELSPQVSIGFDIYRINDELKNTKITDCQYRICLADSRINSVSGSMHLEYFPIKEGLFSGVYTSLIGYRRPYFKLGLTEVLATTDYTNFSAYPTSVSPIVNPPSYVSVFHIYNTNSPLLKYIYVHNADYQGKLALGYRYHENNSRLVLGIEADILGSSNKAPEADELKTTVTASPFTFTYKEISIADIWFRTQLMKNPPLIHLEDMGPGFGTKFYIGISF